MSNIRKPLGVLVSGGLDSAVLLHRLLRTRRRLLPLYVRWGLRWEPAELSRLRRLLVAMRSRRMMPLRVVDVPIRSTYRSHWSLSGRRVPGAGSTDAAVYLPGRNLLLLSHAAVALAPERVDTLALGVLKRNPFGDATPQFFSGLSRCLTEALHRPVRVVAPLRRMSKAELIRAATDVPLVLTWSCLAPRGRRHCGRCNKCAERRRAFRRARVADPTRYAAAMA